jgi:hypothetical protein
MDPQKHKLFEATLDAGETWINLRSVDAWGYEIIFISLGIIVSYLSSRYLFKKKETK